MAAKKSKGLPIWLYFIIVLVILLIIAWVIQHLWIVALAVVITLIIWLINRSRK